MDRIPEIVFILLLIFASTLARRDEIEECSMDDYEHPSYEAMIDFLKVTGPLHSVILNALNHSLGAWQSSCTLVLKEAKEVRKNYMKDLECTSKKELRDHSFMEIDEFIAILKYWCNGMDLEQKDVFFNLNTLQCLNDIKKKFDNCIGYYSTRQKVQNRDYCKTRDSYTMTECIRKATKKCDTKSAVSLLKSIENLVEYSKSISLCDYDSLVWNFHIVRKAVEHI